MSKNDHTMDTVKIRLYYDFASTLCYIAHKVLSGVETEIADLGVELEWRPIDLTMAAPWNRGDSFAEQVRTAVHNTGITLGVDVEMPDPWLDSRPASDVALSAPSASTEARWRYEVFDSIFERKTPELTPELVELAKELVGKESRSAGRGSWSPRLTSDRLPGRWRRATRELRRAVLRAGVGRLRPDTAA